MPGFSLCESALPAILLVLELDLPSLKAADALLATLLDVTFLAILSHYSSFGEVLVELFQAPLLIMGLNSYQMLLGQGMSSAST